MKISEVPRKRHLEVMKASQRDEDEPPERGGRYVSWKMLSSRTFDPILAGINADFR
jgi:hypothetical protein